MTMLAPCANLTLEISDDLDAVRTRWLALQERALATPFQTWEWCARLFRTVGAARGARPLIVMVGDGASGEDVALLPLTMERRGALEVVSFADFGLGDYAMPMFVRDGAFRKETAAQLRELLLTRLPQADVIHFDKMPGEFEGVENPLMGLPDLANADLDCWQTRLPERWEDYEKGLSKNSRRAIRRRAAKLEQLGRPSHEILHGGAEAARMLDLLRSIRKARFEKLGREDAMDDPAVHAFYHGIVEGGDGGMPLVSVLRLDGELVAIVFGMLRDDHFYMLALTFAHGRPEVEKCSPALVLVHRTMASLHAQGLRTYDFSIGDQPYKRTFGAVGAPLHEYIEPLTVKGRAWVAARRLRGRLRRGKRTLLARMEEWRGGSRVCGRNRT